MVRVDLDETSLSICRVIIKRQMKRKLFQVAVILIANKVQFQVLVVVSLSLHNIVLLSVAVVAHIVTRAWIESGSRRSIELDNWLLRARHGLL